jgi:hypothetical protein
MAGAVPNSDNIIEALCLGFFDDGNQKVMRNTEIKKSD